jgi:hypothetical protein
MMNSSVLMTVFGLEGLLVSMGLLLLPLLILWIWRRQIRPNGLVQPQLAVAVRNPVAFLFSVSPLLRMKRNVIPEESCFKPALA